MRKLGAVPLCIGVLVPLILTGCGGSGFPTFTLAATKTCLKGRSAVASVAPPSDSDFGFSAKPLGGDIDVTLRDGNIVELAFYRTGGDASNALGVASLFAKGLGMTFTKLEAHVDGNVAVIWTNSPTPAEVTAVEGCLH